MLGFQKPEAKEVPDDFRGCEWSLASGKQTD
jgi:hypothetical protein